MAIIRKQANMDVVQASKIRIKNVFSNGLPVFFGFSAGKDSLVVANLLYELIQSGEIDPSQLTVVFVDEEGIFPDIEKKAMEWRKKFLMAGAKFDWYCIEVVHYNALNKLQSDETFICWDRFEKDKWIRPMPKFAITDHPLLDNRQESYQSFMERLCKGGITITGVRASESFQRLYNFSIQKKKHYVSPVYDWTDADVWKYLKDIGEKIPEIYLYLYQVGVSKRNLRVSQFFSSDTIGVLVKMQEFYPDLMQRVLRREPNAYIVSLYWDTEMFGRSSAKRRKSEGNEIKKDYKAELMKIFKNMDTEFTTAHSYRVANEYKKIFLGASMFMNERHYKKMYDALIKGDPKERSLRALRAEIFTPKNVM